MTNLGKKLLPILFLALFVIIGTFGIRLDLTAYAINFNDEILIKNDGNGYSYGNAGDMTAASSLQEIIDAVVNSADLIKLNFENVTTDECISFTTEKTFVLNGKLSCGLSDYSKKFITVGEGTTVTLSGLNIEAGITAVKVEKGGILNFNSGSVRVNNKSENHAFNAMWVAGSAVINDGVVIEYNSENNTGSALYQGGSDSIVEINGVNTRIAGNTAAVFNNGNTVINGGNFVATAPTFGSGNANTGSGYALDLQSDSKVTVNGGKFSSKTRENVIYLRGNFNSKLLFNGGEVQGCIRIAGIPSSPSVTVGNRNIKAVTGASVSLFAEGVLTIDNAVLSADCDDGYRLTGWSANGVVTDENPSPNALPEGDVFPIVTNEHTVKVYVDTRFMEFKFVHNEIINLNELAPLPPSGYIIDGWEKDGEEVLKDVTVKGDAEYRAVLKLKPCTVETEGIDCVYDGADKIIIADVQHPILEKLTLTYLWKKYDLNTDEYSTVAESDHNVMEFVTVADSGTYRVEVIAKCGEFESRAEAEFVVTIRKAQYSGIFHDSFGGRYNPNGKLSDYKLNEYFCWKNPSEKPTVTVKKYDAEYLADKDNYLPYSLKITVNLEKADFIDVTHRVLNGLYDPDGRLSGYELDEGYRWKDGSETPTCDKKFYPAIYNIDSDNFNDFALNIQLTLEKASYKDVANPTVTTVYRENLTVANIKHLLPENYSINENGSFSLNAGSYSYDGIYNADPVNYKDFKVTVKVKIEKAEPVGFDAHRVINGVYDAERTLFDYTLDLGWSWQDGTVVPSAGEKEYAAYYNPDKTNYNNAEAVVTLNIAKADLNPDSVSHNEVEISYAPSLRLSDVALDENFLWVEDCLLTAGKFSYYADYNAGDNYNLLRLTVKVTVKKAVYDMSSFGMSNKTVVYNGEKHYMEAIGNLPDGVTVSEYVNNGQINAGKYAVIVKFNQKDETNYCMVKDIRAYLIIKKAPCEIIALERQSAIYDGTVKSAQATINNTEQSLLCRQNNSFTEIGTYKVVFYTEESANYTAGEKTVVFNVNGTELGSGEITESYGENWSELHGKLYDYENGLDSDSVLTVKVKDGSLTDNSVRIEILLDGEIKQGNYKALILLPDELTGVSLSVNHISADGTVTPLNYKINGKYVSFECDKLGEFEIVASDVWIGIRNDVTPWWVWLLTAIGCAAVLSGGAVITLLVLRRRKKNAA